MAPTTAKQWILSARPTGLPTTTGPSPTFTPREVPLPALELEQVLVAVIALSNDPAQRGWIDDSGSVDAERLYIAPVELGEVMRAIGIGKVVHSTAPSIKPGQLVQGYMGWADHTILPAAEVVPLEELPGFSPTHYLGALGLPGLTAYYGLVEVVGTTGADSVVVSGAAGATGSMSVQIAKHLLGCKRVVGIAGGPDKCRFVTQVLGADECLDYKAGDFLQQLKRATTPLVDVFFDNVGGEILDAMVPRLKQGGRISACGSISAYNSNRGGTVLSNYLQVILQRLTIKGFVVLDYLDKKEEVGRKFVEAARQGKLNIGDETETVVDTPFEKIPETWLKLFSGGNTGKLITKLQS